MDAERGSAQQELSEEFITMVMHALDDPDVPLEDRRDIALVAARMLTTGPELHSLDEVLDWFGVTREQLAAIPE